VRLSFLSRPDGEYWCSHTGTRRSGTIGATARPRRAASQAPSPSATARCATAVASRVAGSHPVPPGCGASTAPSAGSAGRRQRSRRRHAVWDGRAPRAVPGLVVAACCPRGRGVRRRRRHRRAAGRRLADERLCTSSGGRGSGASTGDEAGDTTRIVNRDPARRVAPTGASAGAPRVAVGPGRGRNPGQVASVTTPRPPPPLPVWSGVPPGPRHPPGPRRRRDRGARVRGAVTGPTRIGGPPTAAGHGRQDGADDDEGPTDPQPHDEGLDHHPERSTPPTRPGSS